MKITPIVVFVFALALFFPQSALACEPVIPLIIIFGTPFYSLFGIVVLKAIGFAWLERSISPFKSVPFVVIANIVSSIIGLLLVAGSSSPGLLFLSLPLLYWLSIKPAKRFIESMQNTKVATWNPQSVAGAIVILYFLTFILFGLAQTQIKDSLTAYWLLKYLYVLIAISISLGLTTLWEELVISGLSRSEKNYLVTVLKVNLLSFLLIMSFLAIKALPERLKSNNFLIQNVTTLNTDKVS